MTKSNTPKPSSVMQSLYNARDELSQASPHDAIRVVKAVSKEIELAMEMQVLDEETLEMFVILERGLRELIEVIAEMKKSAKDTDKRLTRLEKNK